MRVPSRVPYVRAATLLWGVYALVWLALEGDVGRDGLLAGWGLALLALWVAVRLLGGRELGPGRVAALGAAAGLGWGAALGPAVLLLMAVKTGLHAHGPEYSAAQIAAVVGQWPFWAGAGVLAGAGVGLLALVLAGDR
ncbi:MAG: hypothetical protein KA170_16775 [Candidatus Promineofilum sp.]|nr:hypothetical protein [Promineifilum sp.]